MEENLEVGPRVGRRGLAAFGLLGAGVVTGLLLAGLGVAGAQTSPSPGPSANAPAPAGPKFRHGPGHHRFAGPEHVGFGFGPGTIHGEFTAVAPDGGYRTYATQIGEVTEVSASSLTVRSADGYSRTYRVDDNTLVNAGNEGIGDVSTGDEVRVLALVEAGQAGAVNVTDTTTVSRLHERWMPRPPKPRPSPS